MDLSDRSWRRVNRALKCAADIGVSVTLTDRTDNSFAFPTDRSVSISVREATPSCVLMHLAHEVGHILVHDESGSSRHAMSAFGIGSARKCGGKKGRCAQVFEEALAWSLGVEWLRQCGISIPRGEPWRTMCGTFMTYVGRTV